MKNASCFIFLFPVQENSTNFESGKFVKLTACSLNSPYTEHGDPHFHTVHPR